MPLIRSKTSLPPYALRRSRGSGPSCRGGASSVLRLGQATLPLLPMARTLAQRMVAAMPSIATTAS